MCDRSIIFRIIGSITHAEVDQPSRSKVAECSAGSLEACVPLIAPKISSTGLTSINFFLGHINPLHKVVIDSDLTIGNPRGLNVVREDTIGIICRYGHAVTSCLHSLSGLVVSIPVSNSLLNFCRIIRSKYGLSNLSVVDKYARASLP